MLKDKKEIERSNVISGLHEIRYLHQIFNIFDCIICICICIYRYIYIYLSTISTCFSTCREMSSISYVHIKYIYRFLMYDISCIL